MTIRKRFPAIVALAFIIGCSEKTKQETKEALQESGEAVSSAAEDTKANVKKAGEVVKGAVEGGREKAKELESESPAGDSPADADAVPEAEEQPKP
jgi:hypothetical protein